ncbi:MAG: (2Fe-2S)-binding protein [Oscillatoriales cyanobacterium]|nr:MAG: (2Fe-2S)-binding protein [Oscillatoriales cyanobacterium]
MVLYQKEKLHDKDCFLAGELLLDVAKRAGVSIPTGCMMGSCHACEVEIDDGEAICACISGIPSGKKQVTINLYVDPTW